MNIKEWISTNVKLSRNGNEVRSNSGYFASMAALGGGVGAIVGIIMIIVQFTVSGHNAQQSIISTVSTITLLSSLSYCLYLILPVLKGTELSWGEKILCTIISLVSLVAFFFIGIYITTFSFVAVAIIVFLWILLKSLK